MIIEFCGLPATGKSTAADQACTYLIEKGYKVEKINNLSFVNLLEIDGCKFRKLIGAILIAIKNSMIRPGVAILLLRYFFILKGSAKYRVIWVFTALQYHINWIVQRDNLVKIHMYNKPSPIYILDGSPLNLLIEFDDGAILEKLSSIVFPAYENNFAPTCVVFTIDSIDSVVERVNSRNRKLEQYLYGKKGITDFFYNNYQVLLSAFNKEKGSSIKYENFNKDKLLHDLELYLAENI